MDECCGLGLGELVIIRIILSATTSYPHGYDENVSVWEEARWVGSLCVSCMKEGLIVTIK